MEVSGIITAIVSRRCRWPVPPSIPALTVVRAGSDARQVQQPRDQPERCAHAEYPQH
jgi:hypothetical protein